MQGYDDEYDMKIEENGTVSMQIKYDPKRLTFLCSIISGHLQEKDVKKVFEFNLPMSRIDEERQILQRDGKSFSLFDYVYFEGDPFEVYYLGFSNDTTKTRSSDKRLTSKYFMWFIPNHSGRDYIQIIVDLS